MMPIPQKRKVPIHTPVKPDYTLPYKKLFAAHQVLMRECVKLTTKYKHEIVKARKLGKEIAQLKAQIRQLEHQISRGNQ